MNEYFTYLESSNEQTVTDGDSICSMEIWATEVIIGCFSHCSKLRLMTRAGKKYTNNHHQYPKCFIEHGIVEADKIDTMD